MSLLSVAMLDVVFNPQIVSASQGVWQVSEDSVQGFGTGRARVTGYCVLRLPVKNLKRSIAFYCDVIGYACTHREQKLEALVEPVGDNGPGLFLMQATGEEFRHIHWQQWGETYTAFELFVDNVHALRQRLLEAGATVLEPSIRGDYLTMGFLDPDGHYLFAVDARGRYFSLNKQLEELVGRTLTDLEQADLQRACSATTAHDELRVFQLLLSEGQGARVT